MPFTSRSRVRHAVAKYIDYHIVDARKSLPRLSLYAEPLRELAALRLPRRDAVIYYARMRACSFAATPRVYAIMSPVMPRHDARKSLFMR